MRRRRRRVKRDWGRSKQSEQSGRREIHGQTETDKVQRERGTEGECEREEGKGKELIQSSR